ncbi:MAG: amino acid permease [Vicinamibacterales bacterium]
MATPHLDRAIGPAAATLLVIGGIIGSGIFLTTGVMAATLPSPTLLIAAWIAGGVFALAGALTYAELGTMFPESGGVYVFLHEAFGPLAGFLYGWVTVLVVLGGGIAAVAVGCADYVSYFVPAVGPDRIVFALPLGAFTWTVRAHQLVAVATIAGLAAVNYRGVRAGSGVNGVLTVAKIAGLVLLPVFAIVAATATPAWTPVLPPDLGSPVAAFGVALIAVLWTTEGYYFLTYAAGELRDPGRTMPRALALGLLAVVAIYVAVNLAYLYALPMDELRGASRVAERAAMALVGPAGATVIALTVVVSTLGANAAVILGGSRVMYAMAARGRFFRAMAAVHPRYHSPHVAVIALAAWASILALTGTYEQLFTYVVFASVLFSVLGGLALFRLRATRPGAPRPYRVWAYPVVPVVFVAGALYLVVNTLIERPVESLAGVAFLVLGIPAYAGFSAGRVSATDGRGPAGSG